MIRPAARVMLTAALLVPLAASTGCEERVVKVHNPYIGSRRPPAPEPQGDGPIEATGKALGSVVDGTADLLFGWTKPQPQVTVNNTYNAGATQPTQTTTVSPSAR